MIPALAKQVEAAEDVLQAQKLRDLRAARDDLERRVHDLLLTRQVTMQALPSIRLVQENDKSLVTKINSTITNTVPLWRQQLAQAVTIYRMGEAADSVKAASDLTNELLKNNAENLQTANAQVRRQVERGVFDIETVKEANAQAGRHDQREPADRRRGQAAPGRGRGPAADDGGRAAERRSPPPRPRPQGRRRQRPREPNARSYFSAVSWQHCASHPCIGHATS